MIFEPKTQLILYSKNMEVGGYSLLFEREVDDGYLMTFLGVLLLATVVIKEVYRLSMRANNTYRIRIEGSEILLGWFLRYAFTYSEIYLANFPTLLSTIFLLTVLFIFLVEFAYPCLSFTFTPREKLLKYAVILLFVAVNFSIVGMLLALAVQVLCVFITREEGKKLGAVGCYIEMAYILLVCFVFEHLLLSPTNALNYENSNKYAVFLVFATLLQMVYTYTKFTGFILPFERASLIKQALQNRFAHLLAKTGVHKN